MLNTGDTTVTYSPREVIAPPLDTAILLSPIFVDLYETEILLFLYRCKGNFGAIE